jgi:hypothetical protein
MATIYKFKVECVSAFCAYPEQEIACAIANALKQFEDKKTGLRLESISVSGKDTHIT